MKCHQCGGTMESVTTDLPFKVSASTIVILKALPVHQCGNCGEYLLEDNVMAAVEKILAAANANVELEVIRYAA